MSEKSRFESLTEYRNFLRAIKNNKLDIISSYTEEYSCNSMITLRIPGLRDPRFPIDVAMAYGNKKTCDKLVKEGMSLKQFCVDPLDQSGPKINPIIAAYLHERDDIASYLMETYPEEIHFTDSLKKDGKRLADFFDDEGAYHLAKVAHHAEISSHNKQAEAHLKEAEALEKKAAAAFEKAAQLKKIIPRNAIIQNPKSPIKKFQK